MNDIIVQLFEPFFDWNAYQDLLKIVYNNFDYGKIGFILLVLPLIVMAIFYKVWEPMKSQLLMWSLSILAIMIILYSSTSGFLYSNFEFQQYIGNYTGDDGQIDPDYFIFQMSMISVLYSAILAFIYSLILKQFSTNNSHNPF